MEKTLFICKPDAVRRGLVGEILKRLENKGLRFLELQQRTISEPEAKEHYVEHADKAFFDDLVAFITSGPSVLAVVTGDGDVIKIVRGIMGATDPSVANPGTIRGDLATIVSENLVHGSDSMTAAQREIKLFFPNLEA
ncbi:nucleoside diphosphate kinase [Ferrithrix thermotolerans DSM 19514]|jgi:nucleoside-diphosphate kinase|uniref:Nucleoside diphosphate kinase n=1 Tax=Ferrithrix thermotolerans DSM 19514 TaxID=1121881 RepID=A0A1M4W5H2_9ACTN|nr:nucleoside-diphosphate kinase [Ferrithrix thermotolerans]SHE76457.1 nucleoside diphosphate kinase [Ferrithrix thermotolerans DSM 19514]